MKLSTRCRYATLALFDIAFHNDGKPTQVRQIAERQSIPTRFLEQIFQDLRRAELVDGKRGRNGGYFLRREPGEITLGDIIRATDGPIEISPHKSGDSEPKDSRIITTQIWTEIGERVSTIYEEYSLEVLVERAEAAGFTRGDSAYMYFI